MCIRDRHRCCRFAHTIKGGHGGRLAGDAPEDSIMRVKLRVLASVLSVALATGGIGKAAAQSTVEDGAKDLWFIELTGSVDAFRTRAKNSRIDYTERYVYRRIWNGLSVKSSRESVSCLLY